MAEQRLATDAQPERSELFKIAQAFVKSGYFDKVTDMYQATVKILAGKELGIGPFASMNGIHIIDGKLTLSAGLIAHLIKSSRHFDYRVTRLDNTQCTIEFFENGTLLGESTYSHDDAAAANLLDKKNWKTSKRNMLFARAMSNGAKWFTPAVFHGPVYTPEEFDRDDLGEETFVGAALGAPPAPALAPSAPTPEETDVAPPPPAGAPAIIVQAADTPPEPTTAPADNAEDLGLPFDDRAAPPGPAAPLPPPSEVSAVMKQALALHERCVEAGMNRLPGPHPKWDDKITEGWCRTTVAALERHQAQQSRAATAGRRTP